MTLALPTVGSSGLGAPTGGAGGGGALADFVTSSQVEFLDVADASKSDTNAIVGSQSTAGENTTFNMEHPSTGVLDRIDTGCATFAWTLTDRLGATFKTGTHMGPIVAGIDVVTGPGDSSSACISIGTRINGTTTWAAYGIAWTAASRYGLITRNSSSSVSVAVATAKSAIGNTILAPSCFVALYGTLYTTGGDYNRQQDTLIQSEANTGTDLELIVNVGYRATGDGAAHAPVVRLWYLRPWSWTIHGGVV